MILVGTRITYQVTGDAGCIVKRLIQNLVSLPCPKRDLETQTAYHTQNWQQELYVPWSIRPPSLVMIRGL